MESKIELEKRAKALLDSSPGEAYLLYKKLWNEFMEEFNHWDAFFTIKALKAIEQPEIEFAIDLAEKFKDERVSSIFGWLIFDKYVKNRSRPELISNESLIEKLVEIVPQRNLRENNSYPCPVTISVFQLADAYAAGLFNAPKINQWLNKLNTEFLSKESKTISTEKKDNVKIASDLEKYYSLKSKALLSLKMFEDCKMMCKQALSELTEYHYNNDLWFKMRIAICCNRLGDLEKSKHLFKELLSTKAGKDKWFLYKDIAELYFEQKDFNTAWKYAVDAAFYGNEPHFMIGLYHLQARILYKLGRHHEGEIFAQLIAATLKEQGWKKKHDYNKLFQFYNVDNESIGESKYYYRIAREFWVKERYKGKTPLKGTIISVHKNSKKGRIKSDDGGIFDFHRGNFIERQRNLHDLNGATVEFFQMEGLDGNINAENISILMLPESLKENNVKGEILTGTVKNIVDFGVFVKLKGLKDGLLHKNNLPENFRLNYKEYFKIGQSIKVRVIKVTQKGIELALHE